MHGDMASLLLRPIKLDFKTDLNIPHIYVCMRWRCLRTLASTSTSIWFPLKEHAYLRAIYNGKLFEIFA